MKAVNHLVLFFFHFNIKKNNCWEKVKDIDIVFIIEQKDFNIS